MGLNKMMREFDELYSVEPLEHTMENLNQTLRLILDEYHEAVDETVNSDKVFDLPIENINRHNLAKELGDILYITSQRMTAMGIDVDAVMGEIHRSNMSKQVPIVASIRELTVAKDRYPEARFELVQGDMGVLIDAPTGKVIKPTCYSAAVITDQMIGI